ncbi:DUF2637 domain-containing protein [Kitasatospora sp. NBC_00240]|uniref:DUF2637 domain-containing protein n=1 Tax=Kitasatospora sp. NBC_00240 TaxID=2903567 RepID=UPI00224CB314|nr:DUF2637 domain-containing protein [Kitasatospora sp. NBC_00240]MCX5213146.1 DUF2637 domain-containing protein [Kitasatospora sp. NBC_00240]
MSRAAKFWIVAALLAVVGMAFRVSWNALKDVAGAIGADPTAATVYPLVVDGLMALALVAVLVLTGADRRFALRVLVGYTVASLVLNYVHGLVPTLHGPGRMRLADWAPAHWALVLLASSLPVGSIYFGSDLVAKVLHHKPEPAEKDQSTVNRSVSDLPEHTDPAEVESVYESPAPVPAPAPTAPAVAVEPVRTVKSVAAPVSRARRATGSVPKSARSVKPSRTPVELLAEARSATAGWSDRELTADRIREAVRTSSVNARTLRDALKAERAERPALHAVPDAAPAEGEAPAEQAS